MLNSCAFIVIDSGFSREILTQSKVPEYERKGFKVIAAWDLPRDKKFEASDCLSEHQIDEFGSDPMGHGTIVLEKLLNCVPDAKLILVKAFTSNEVCRTVWNAGEIAEPGWTEAYVWAVEQAKSRGMVSVANCSFGGVSHALDGTGWEAHQVSRCTGAGKPGHVLVAAAGTGDGRATHGSLTLLDGENKSFVADQDSDCEYNVWFGLNQIPPYGSRWQLEAWQNGAMVYSADSDSVPGNMWNGRQQLKFRLWGSSRVEIDVRREGGWQYEDGENPGLKVDVYVEGARFRNWVSSELIPEPACFPAVIAVGLQASIYSARQTELDRKPDILLPGSGQISFRIPEIAAAVGQLLARHPRLDVDGVRAILGKFPQ